MELNYRPRGGSYKITGIKFQGDTVTIINNDKPVAAPAGGKEIRDYTFEEQMALRRAQAMLGFVLNDYHTRASKDVPVGEPIPPKAKDKALAAMGIEGATMLQIEELLQKVREEESRQAEEKSKKDAEKQPVTVSKYQNDRQQILCRIYLEKQGITDK